MVIIILRKHIRMLLIPLLVLIFQGVPPLSLFPYWASGAAVAAETVEIPATGMVTMVDLGAKKCIPCKMMAPILERLEKAYRGRAVIHFFDVWENPEPAKRFNIRAIPTQIFFDKDKQEVFRHEGFMSEEDIVTRLAAMGVK